MPKKKLIISSHSHLLVVWELIVFLVAIAVTITIPLITVFHMKEFILGDIVYNLATVFFLLDILVKFNTDLFVRQELIISRKMIALNYLKGYFILDLLAMLPLAGLVRTLSVIHTGRIISFLPLNRLLKLFCIVKTLNRLRKITFINPVFIRLFLLIFWILVVAHLVACGWILIQDFSFDTTESDLSNKVRYLKAYYWTVTTLTTIGYGDITPSIPIQYIYTIFVMLMGAALYGIIIGNIANIIANIDVAKNQFRDRMETINAFLKYRNIPGNLQKRISDYYDYLWESRRGYEESKLLEDLPIPLKTQVSFFLNQEILQKVPIFHNASKELLRELLLNLKPIIFTPGDYIVNYGEIGFEMYFISRGAVEVLNEDESISYAILQSGQYFGEIALLLSTPRTASVKAKEYCDLYMLDKETFDNILGHYPDFAKSVEAQAEDNRRKLGLIEYQTETDLPPEKQPPGIPKKLQYKILEDGVIEISWEPGKLAETYEIIRQNRGDEKWIQLSKGIPEQRFIDQDPPMATAIYSVRSINNFGRSKWSHGIIIDK